MASRSTDNIWSELAPSIVMFWPLPSTVRFMISGRVPLLPSVIVPLTLNLMVSMPVAVPTAQSPPVVSVPRLLALLIASRKVQNPLSEVLAGSVVLFTVMIAMDPVRADLPGLERADVARNAVAVFNVGKRETALVGGGAVGKRDRVDRVTARVKRDGLGRAAVVRQARGIELQTMVSRQFFFWNAFRNSATFRTFPLLALASITLALGKRGAFGL